MTDKKLKMNGNRGFNRFLIQTQINTDFHRLLKYDLIHEESEESGICIEIPHFVRNDNFRWGKDPTLQKSEVILIDN